MQRNEIESEKGAGDASFQVLLAMADGADSGEDSQRIGGREEVNESEEEEEEEENEEDTGEEEQQQPEEEEEGASVEIEGEGTGIEEEEVGEVREAEEEEEEGMEPSMQSVSVGGEGGASMVGLLIVKWNKHRQIELHLKSAEVKIQQKVQKARRRAARMHEGRQKEKAKAAIRHYRSRLRELQEQAKKDLERNELEYARRVRIMR